MDAIKKLHKQQERLMWQAIVDEQFADQHSPAANRRGLVAQSLGRQDEWVTRRILTILTPDIAGPTPTRPNAP